MIKDADQKGLLEIARELTELSGKAREGKLSPGDMQGGTFTISSLGGIGGTSFTPIINAPEVAILGVTRSAMKPVWDGREFVPRLMVPLSLSYDHRVIDGAAAARFVVHLVRVLGRSAPGAAVSEVRVPDIGDFTDVPVIEITRLARRRGRGRGPAGHARVRQGDDGRAGAAAGTVKQLRVQVGDRVSEGSVLLTLEPRRRPERRLEAGRLGAGAGRSGRADDAGRGRAPTRAATRTGSGNDGARCR